MPGLQSLVILVGLAFVVFYFVNGLRSGSVWIKGSSKTAKVSNAWASKVEKEDQPLVYYFFMTFYGGAALYFLYLLAHVNGWV